MKLPTELGEDEKKWVNQLLPVCLLCPFNVNICMLFPVACNCYSFFLSFSRQSTNEALAIVQRFPFSSAMQRMSVVTVTRGGRSALAFIKGSPEMVASLCKAETGQ